MDLQAIRTLIETERTRFEVPGVAVAVVKDGDVVFSEGFGLADLDRQQPMTADTHLPIASDTKCFTAATLCQLADEGLLDLDAPIRAVVPWFELADPHATALASVRDLLSHRTGLPRHDLVWYGETDHTLESIARSLKHLELSRQLRQTWQYNNLTYATAGYVTEVVTGEAWEAAVTHRLLTPAGMKNTVFSVTGLAPDALATPYKRSKGVDVAMGLPKEGGIAPAGAIVSTANDMAQWLLARLGAKPEVLSTAALAQLHGPSMIGAAMRGEFAERQPVGYALGCQAEAYRGMRLISHGGNLVGYSSMVTVVPEHGLGIAVLTNSHGTPLRDVLPLAIVDLVLGLEPAGWGERLRELQLAMLGGEEAAREHHEAKAAGRPASRPLAEFTGSYVHPAYGVLGVSVSPEGDELVPDFHGLGAEHSLRHRSGDVWDLLLHDFDMATPVVFAQGPDGAISGLTAVLDPLVAPIAFERQPDPVDPALLAALPGTYVMGPVSITIRRRGEGLVADVPGAGTLTLVHTGGSTFTAAELPAAVIDATFADGAVTQVLVDPVGVFLPA